MPSPCLACAHRRVPRPPVPSCVSDPTNRKRLRWEEEWRQITEKRWRDENDHAERTFPPPDAADRDEEIGFGLEPWYFAWCACKSQRRRASSGGLTLYILAEQHHRADCRDFQAPGSAPPPLEKAPAPQTPSRARKADAWDDGRSF